MNNTDDNTRLRVLCIDDSALQLNAYQQHLEPVYNVVKAKTYEDAIAALTTRKPDLILLDMVMPLISGLEFLEILRYSPSFDDIPVIIVSGDNDAGHVRSAFLKGAVDYIRKPYDKDELNLRISRLLQFVKPKLAQGFEGFEHYSARALMIQSLADLATTRDNETGQHLVRIEKYVEALSQAAAKDARYKDIINIDFIKTITSLAVLHDIGKVSTPDRILYKPERLTPEEFEVMKRHTTSGADTIAKIQESFPEYTFLKTAKQIVLHHHEKWDGTGYPKGLAGHDIPIQARIVAIADVLDALTMKRVYKSAQSFDDAMGIIVKERGKHFDPDLIDIFIANQAAFRTIHTKYRDGM